MKTDDLITMLAQDAAAPRPAPIAGRAWAGIGLGFAVALVIYAVMLGPRPDLAALMMNPVILAKTLLPLALFALALRLGLRAVRPAADPGRSRVVIWAIPALTLALFVWAFAVTPPESRMVDFLGHSIPVCLPAINLLSLPILAGLIAALRRGAPVDPQKAGALAGLASAGLATALYSTFCTENSPLFYAVWYSAGIAITAALGAVAGQRWLRW